MFYIQDSEGNVKEATTEEYLEARKDFSRFVVKQELAGGYRVSTVFLGINHQFDDPNDPPVLWETMVFGVGRHSGLTCRYSSMEEAKEGHAHIVKLLSEELNGREEPKVPEGRISTTEAEDGED